MPDYFFHVAIELCPDPELTADAVEPQSAVDFFKALKPFTSRGARANRDHRFDTRRQENLLGPRAKGPSLSDHPAPVYPSASDDHRLDTVYVDGAAMTGLDKYGEAANTTTNDNSTNLVNRGIGSALTSSYLKGQFAESNYDEGTAASWGIVHLYRDADPTPSLALHSSRPYQTSDLWSDSPRSVTDKTPHNPPTDAECTTLCILAVPSYMTPADFLAFVGPGTRDAVSHFRMLRTSRQNRYMVLMKFREGKIARKWQAEWNGKIWNAMEPETCHVVFLKSVELVVTNPTSKAEDAAAQGSYPQVVGDPFSPSIAAAASSRPLAPPTPNLIELPTCPVCLERMDETTGLLTIPCQHVFHCTCLQKWSGGGCPVCRYTHDDFSSRTGFGKVKKKTKKLGKDGSCDEYEVDDDVLECETCHEDGASLWQCLICGKVGCGRYDGKHAYKHYEESKHLFAMDLSSKRVWDYGGDGYVHRIMVEDRSAGKDSVEVDVREVADSDYGDNLPGKGDPNVDVENLALEYTHLLTSQLDSQRVYFEGIVERAVDKASEASRKAESAEREAAEAVERLRKLEADNDFVTKGKVPELEKERERWEAKARKLEDMAKDINARYLEERAAVKGLMSRIQHLESTELTELRKKIQALEEENATKDLLMGGLREEHRDAMVQVSAERQLREMVERGELQASELEGAEVSVGKRPLTARERLQERLQTERQVRGGKKSLGAKGEEKGKAKEDTGAGTGADVGSSSSPADALAALLKTFGVNDVDSLAQGDAYDAAKASALVQDLRAQMLEQGLIKIGNAMQKGSGGEEGGVPAENAGTVAATAAADAASTAGTGGRKKGKKGRGRH